MASIRQVMIDISKEAKVCSEKVNMECARRGYLAANELRNAELDVLGHAGNGRQYKNHRASAPGEPPAPRTGALRNRWTKRVSAVPTGNGVSIGIAIESDAMARNGAYYAGFLEHGTRKMSARPFGDKIRDKAEPKIVEIYKRRYL